MVIDLADFCTERPRRSICAIPAVHGATDLNELRSLLSVYIRTRLTLDATDQLGPCAPSVPSGDYRPSDREGSVMGAVSTSIIAAVTAVPEGFKRKISCRPARGECSSMLQYFATSDSPRSP